MIGPKGVRDMEQIDRERFGTFLSELRKEKSFTQQELADRLFVSNKAVSKWERGLSLPDISLLTPLADILGVTVAELLKGERLAEGQVDAYEVKDLVDQAVQLSAEEQKSGVRKKRFWHLAWGLSALVSAGEIALLRMAGTPWDILGAGPLVVVLLCTIFGYWVCYVMRERLPTIYDKEKLSFYADGVFRMNMGNFFYFNNSNWPHIVRTLRMCLTVTPVVFPLVFWLLRGVWSILGLAVTLLGSLGFFFPVLYVGRRYQ